MRHPMVWIGLALMHRLDHHAYFVQYIGDDIGRHILSFCRHTANQPTPATPQRPTKQEEKE